MRARTITLLAATALTAVAVTAGAMAHTSATFDEIVLVAGGVRGVERGAWDMVTDQPPVMMYAYGEAARTASPRLPPEAGRTWSFEQRWTYARTLFFRLGNDPVRLLDRARWVGVALVGLLVLLAALYAGWAAGPVAAGLTAVMVAATPDVLAHGGVAYNDLPLALAFLLAVWALDATVRRPSPLRGVLAGAAVALALGVKLSALALAPVALLLVGAEAVERRRDRAWWADVAVASVAGLAGVWAVLMVIYRGDPSLTLFRLAFWRTVLHTEQGHPAAAYLLGHTSAQGWWFFFPVVFFFKTPAGFQALLALGAAGLMAGLRGRGGGRAWRSALHWRGRGALIGLVVFGAFLMRSHLDAGFRYALPVLPLLAVVASAGLVRAWDRGRRWRGAIVALLALQLVSVATAYPDLLAYTSVWAGGRDRADRVLVDSSLDWGQGLLELRSFMKREGVHTVRLAYFGSALPHAYGIDYVPLPSFFRLTDGDVPEGTRPPRFTVVSATLLHGLYLQGHDPFAGYRKRTPYRVLGHTLFVYEDGTGVPNGPSSSGGS